MQSGEKVLVLKKKYRDVGGSDDTSAANKAPDHKPKLAAPKKKLQDSFQVQDQSSPSPETNNNVTGAVADESTEDETLTGACAEPMEGATAAEPEEEMSLLAEIQKSLSLKSSMEVEQVTVIYMPA